MILLSTVVLAADSSPGIAGGEVAGEQEPRTTDADPRGQWRALGLSAGVPQALALTYERPLEGPFRFQTHVFTILVFTSVGARLVVPVPDWPVRPYAYGGFGLTHKGVGRHDSPSGGEGFLWWGGGVRWWMGRVLGFVELSRMKPSAWNEDDLDAGVSVGLLWSWED